MTRLLPSWDGPVFSKGDVGKHLYSIESGQIDIIDEIDDGQEKAGQLVGDDFFGELALFKNVPRHHDRPRRRR